MAIQSVKSSLEYAQELQVSMQNNPLKQDNTSKEDRESSIKDAASKVDAKSLMMSYTMQFQLNISVTSQTNFGAQSGLFGSGSSALNDPLRLGNILSNLDLSSIGYTGKPLTELTQQEAADLISEDGFFGIAKTSERIADFVIAGAGDDIEKLKAGREGIVRGYEQAQKSWGGDLPDISKETLQKALEKVDKRLAELGGNVLEQNA